MTEEASTATGAWRPCCGECGCEYLQEAEGHPLYCGRCGAAWDGSEVMRYPSGHMGPSSWRWRWLDLEARRQWRGVGGAEYEEWLAMVVSG